MVILGLGSNVGDRLFYLRKALALIKALPNLNVKQVSPVYISDALLPDNAPNEWNQPFLNLALRCETSLSPHELLFQLQQIELRLGREQHAPWSPRVIDIDILAWDNFIHQDEKLCIPHRHLLARPFALWPLLDVAPLWIHPVTKQVGMEVVAPWGSRFMGEAPFKTRQIAHRIDTPKLVGVLNITPDSFSDGGDYLHIEKALEQAQCLVTSGAEVIDIGAESTRPNAARPLNADEEWQRLEPVLIELKNNPLFKMLQPKMSIDTRHADTAKKCIDLGVDWINDVTGLSQPTMRECIANSKVDCVVMHHLTIPVDPTKTIPLNVDPTEFLLQWTENKLTLLQQEGISLDRIILDTGIGFGKNAHQSLALLKQSKLFKQFGVRLLIGHSRKSFMQLFTSLSAVERDIETMVMALELADQEVDYLRVHNVEMCARGLKVKQAMAG